MSQLQENFATCFRSEDTALAWEISKNFRIIHCETPCMAIPLTGPATIMANTGNTLTILMTILTRVTSLLGNGINPRKITSPNSTSKAVKLAIFFLLTLSQSTCQNCFLKCKLLLQIRVLTVFLAPNLRTVVILATTKQPPRVNSLFISRGLTRTRLLLSPI